MRLFWIFLTGFIIVLSGWFAIFGGEFVLPRLDREWENDHWHDYLLACRPNEMRVQNYIAGEECQKGILDLNSGQLIGAPAPVVVSYIEFWQRIYSVFHTLNFPTREYSETELLGIRSALAQVKDPPALKVSSYHDQFHLAFSQESHVLLYSYPRLQANEMLSDLFHALHFQIDDHFGGINAFAP